MIYLQVGGGPGAAVRSVRILLCFSYQTMVRLRLAQRPPPNRIGREDSPLRSQHIHRLRQNTCVNFDAGGKRGAAYRSDEEVGTLRFDEGVEAVLS